MNAVWGTSATDIYAAGSGTIVHSTGDGAWMHQNPATTARFTGIWGSGPQDIYISAFSNLILHTVGDGKWEHTVFAAGRTYEDVWGSGPGDVYAVSGGATRFKNGTWVEPTERVSTDGEPLRALWGSSASDVYIAGSGGSVFHSIGDGKWQKQVTGATNLQDITGNGKGDVYALSVTSVFHSIGNGVWTPQPVPALLDGGTPEGMRCIWALDSTAVYVGTSEGRLFRSGGSGSWVAQTIDPAKNGLTVYGIWGTGTSNLYVATTAGIYHGSAP